MKEGIFWSKSTKMKVFYYLLREEGVIIARIVVLEYVLKKFQHILLYLLLSSIVENMKKIVRVDIERLK